MRYVKPHYYDDFRCTADKCPDTCCAGWQIVIDDESLERYEECVDLFGSRLRNDIDWQEGCFKQYNRRCAMLNEQNLCDLVIEKGEAWLCTTCDRYPRHIEEFDGVREMSLSLSCPVVAKMMLKSQEKVSFIVEEDEEDEPLWKEFEDFDYMLYTYLLDAREVLFLIVQNRELSINERMSIIMKFAEELQACVDEERLYDMENVIERYRKHGYTEEIRQGDKPDEKTVNEAEYDWENILRGKSRYQYLKDNFEVFYKLERLRDDWSEVVDKTRETLYENGFDNYKRIYDGFYGEFVSAFGQERWDIFREQILMFFIYTYFCGAVYDDCIYSKVGMAVYAVEFVGEFIMSSWYLSDKNLSLEECIRLAYRYAREVEHSDVNLNILEEWLMEE
ncbi:MAG: flagellin lysine-N-methylase [Lachnospiraceae bacterium]|nr:flagellin lysine-N-methylase [Lachnospiraceae bacterium]